MSGLLERESELEALATATADAASGSGVVFLVHGEPGIGKTSLVRAYLSRLVPGTRTLVGGCDDLITPRALGPLRDAVRWRGGPLADALDGSDSRDAVFSAVIDELSHPRDVTVLVVEDVHWADDATLDVLTFVVRRIDTLRAVVVLTYRDDELDDDHPLLPLLGAAAGPRLRRLPVPRLSAEAVATLSAPSGHDPATVYAVTGGNAFFVTETVAAAASEVPSTVVDAVLARVRQLDAPTQRALEQLSVVPTRVEHRLVEGLLGGLDVLAEAERRGVLRVDRERVAFRHELARRAIEQSLPATRRVALNRALVSALLAAPDPDVSRVVHHAVEAGDVETIVRYAPTAGREAARAGSHRQALAQFEEVLRHERHLPLNERARVLEEYAWELYNAHRFQEAADAAERSYQLWQEVGDEAAIGTALVTLSRHRWMSADPVAAWRAIEAATQVLDRTDDLAARAHAHTYRGAILALRGDVDESVPQLQHARSLAETAGAEGLVALCLNYLGMSAIFRGEDDEAIALHRQSLAHAKQAHDGERGAEVRAYVGEHVARGYSNLATALYWSGRYDDLETLLDEALPYVRDRGFTSHAYLLGVWRCASLMRRGLWDDAETTFRELDGSVRDPGTLGRFMLPLYGRLLARRGNPDAEQVLERAMSHAQRSSVRLATVEAALAYLEWAWLTDQPDKASQRLVAALAVLHPERHRRVRGELLRYAKRAGLTDTGSFDGCPEPWAAGLRGDWFAAATMWQRAGDDYERALELAESGDVAVTTEALALLDKLGAAGTATVVRRRLRELGATRVPRGPQPATKANPGGLTDRQVDVLRLLTRGLTNVEIADELVVSVRTVDHHVAAVLGKLQVPSRRRAAQRAVELGIG